MRGIAAGLIKRAPAFALNGSSSKKDPSSFLTDFSSLSSLWRKAATWAIANGKFVNTPVPGNEIFQNTGFDDASFWQPIGQWGISGGVASRAAGASAEVIRKTGINPDLNAWYKMQYDLVSISGSWIQPYSCYATNSRDYQRYTSGTNIVKTDAADAAGTTEAGFRANSTTACSLDNVSLKKLTTTELFSVIKFSKPTGKMVANWLITAGINCGVVMCLDNPLNPLNCVIAMYNGQNLQVIQRLNGVNSRLLGVTAVTYGAAKNIKLVNEGSGVFKVYYGTAGSETQVGGTLTVNAAILNNKYHGLFSTNEGAQCIGASFNVNF